MLQNLPNYITILAGVFFANIILLFGFVLPPLVDRYEKDITSNVICEYQYILKAPAETKESAAEKYSVTALQTVEGRLKSEEVMVCCGIFIAWDNTGCKLYYEVFICVCTCGLSGVASLQGSEERCA